MRVYIGVPWNDREKAIELAEILEKKGHEITHKWWKYDGDYGTFTKEFGKKCADKDYEGVVCAEVFVLVNSSLSEGKATELGIAIANWTPIIAIGEPSRNIFHYWRTVKWVKDNDELIKELEASL